MNIDNITTSDLIKELHKRHKKENSFSSFRDRSSIGPIMAAQAKYTAPKGIYDNPVTGSLSTQKIKAYVTRNKYTGLVLKHTKTKQTVANNSLNNLFNELIS